jgi:hypothetical protein
MDRQGAFLEKLAYGILGVFGLILIISVIAALTVQSQTEVPREESQIENDSVDEAPSPVPDEPSNNDDVVETDQDVGDPVEPEPDAIQDVSFDTETDRVLVKLSDGYVDGTGEPYSVALAGDQGEVLLENVTLSGQTLIFSPDHTPRRGNNRPRYGEINSLMVLSQDADITTTDTPSTSITPPEDYGPVLNPLQASVVNELSVTVEDAQSFDTMASSFDQKTTEGKFIKLYLDVENQGKETKRLSNYAFKLQDNQDRTFDSITASMYTTDVLTWMESLQPGLSTEGAIVFEVPDSVENPQLLVQETGLETTTLMRLAIPEPDDIGIDTSKKEETEAQLPDYDY